MFSVILALQIILTLLYVAYLIHQYSMLQVNWVVKILVYITWLLSFIIVVMLPYDIYNSLQEDYAMSVVWKCIYYAIFALTWLFLPIAQEYQTAGQFTFKDKIKTAIINNLIIYGIFILIGVVFFVYLTFKDQLNLKELMPILMAASNAFGMFLVVIFLSYGLVAIPKELWREKKYQIKLKQKQFNAAGLFHKKQNLLQELQLKVKELLWQQKQHGQSAQSNYILNLVPEKYREKWTRKNIPELGQISLIKLHKEIKELLLELCRLESRWEQLIYQTFHIEDIIMNVNNLNHRIQSTLFSVSKYEIVNYLKWFWFCRAKLVAVPLLAIFFSIFALAIIIAELTVFLPALNFLNPFGHLISIQDYWALDCSLMIVMAYIVFCVYYALFKLKFSGYYGLYWNKQTDASSLMFFAINCSRVSTPLCYNFLQIINDKNTAFSTVMGNTDIVPVLGQTFYYIFPILLLILIIVNAFDVYSLIAKMFGLQKFIFESDFNHENIEEGKKLLQRARLDIENKILNSNNKDLSEYRSYKSELGVGSTDSTNKENVSSDQLQLKGHYFNQFQNMDRVKFIMGM